jgi:hypothetical protein
MVFGAFKCSDIFAFCRANTFVANWFTSVFIKGMKQHTMFLAHGAKFNIWFVYLLFGGVSGDFHAREFISQGECIA